VTATDAELEAAGSERGGARFLGVLACFFLSGFAALIYQTAWTRQFAFVFGTSELAVATVLAAYMGGLAAGAGIAGRHVARVTRPILAYGLIELGIAVCALAVPLGIRAAQWLYLAAFGAAGEPPGEGGLATALFYLLCSFVILFPATALMGATLPLLARHAVRDESEIGSRIGALYSANTIGAVAGTTVAGFLLLPALGLGLTLWTAVAVNAGVFVLAALLARNAAPATTRTASDEGAAERNGWILPLIAASGAVSFLYEVLWTRMLGQILGGSVYAFATMLGTFLTGIALGSWIASRLATTRERSVLGFALAQLGTAALALSAFVLADRLPELARSMGNAGPLSDAALCAVVLLPSTLFIGATFPFAVRIHARDERDASSGSARVYAWNTLGSIVGAVGAGFFLVPALGYSGSMTGAVAVNLLLAGAAAWRSARLQRPLLALAAASLVLLMLAPPDPPWKLLANSPLSGRPTRGDIFYFSVGRSSTVQVRERAGSYALLTNGLQEAIIEPPGASFLYSPLAPWMAALPVLARPDTHSMLIVGLGGGGVVEAAPDSLERIDVVELEPEVVEANHALSELRAIDPLADPRVNMTVDDARGSLLLTQRRYDAIVSQPSHPWTAGASHLYTREFFELARDRLEDDGMLLQWMGLGFVDDALLQTLVASLLSVFDHVNLYAPIHGGILLLASAEPFAMFESSRQALQEAPVGAFATLGVFTPEDVLAARVLDTRAARVFAAGAPVNTDDHNLLQTRSPAIARAGAFRVDLQSLAGEADPVLKLDAEQDRIRLVSGLIRRGFPARAERLAERIEDEAEGAHARALTYPQRGSNQSKQRQLWKEALALAPDSDPIKLGLITTGQADFLRGDAELSELAGSMNDPYAAIASGIRLAPAAEQSDAAATAGLRALAPRLEACPPDQACFEWSLRLRALGLLASGGDAEAAEALALLEQFASVLSRPSDKLLRAQAAAASGAYRAAIALIFQVDLNARKRPGQARLLAGRAVRILSSIPQDQLDAATRRLQGALRRMASGQRPSRAR
jgi:spermidine synthase